MPRTPLAAVLACVAALILSLPAQAAVIHRHVTDYHVRVGPDRQLELVPYTEVHVVQVPGVAPVPTYAPSSTSTGGCGGITPYPGGGECWAIPYYIVACESGGDLGAQNASSGAYGAYQLLGHGEYPGMPKAEQDAIAAGLWAGGAGRSNWVC